MCHINLHSVALSHSDRNTFRNITRNQHFVLLKEIPKYLKNNSSFIFLVLAIISMSYDNIVLNKV